MKNVPILEPGLDAVWDIFHDLSSDRQIGMAVGPIPWSSVCLWADRSGLDEVTFDYLLTLLRAMDEVYLQHMAKKSETSSGGGDRGVRQAHSRSRSPRRR